MPPIMSKPSKAAFLAITFIVIGALTMVNTAIFYFWIVNHHQATGTNNDSGLYWCAAFFFSGLTLFLIGLAVGRIGRAARHAELPPEVPPGERTAQPAVAPPQVVSPIAANGQPVLPGQAVMPGQPVAAVPPVAPTAPTARVR